MADLYGIELPDLDPGEMAVGAVVTVKYINAEGRIWTWDQVLGDMSYTEAIGTLRVHAGQLERAVIREREGAGDGDDI